MRKNAVPLMFNIFQSNSTLKPHRDEIYDVFDREYNVPANGKEVWETKRKLEKIFEVEKIQDRNFNFHNTLMIDSEQDKVIDYPLNSIVVPEYTKEEVIAGKEAEGKTSLLQVLDYLI